ncbi:DUF853 domain-containing protein [Granulicatella seriolae]|uniref:DUF853 domain-containing protein n=1 Tax=Granulicatella seriolae TaxID=2967226 RepID=A0ABT1WMI8_9LACT|nr:DUF853 domain-containing protein [Granulicatella seriolae]
MATQVVIGKGSEPAVLLCNKLNRHGIIAGATGTGKTVTLKVLAEQLSEQGIPVFLSDIKGDLASLAQAGEVTDKIQERLTSLDYLDYEPSSYPTQFWDVRGQDGIAIRTTISEMGPILLSQLLGLNDTQEGILNIAFKVADDEGLLLIDLKDLRAMLNYVASKAGELRSLYGNIAQQSIGAILRSLLVLEEQGGDVFFGEPAFEIADLLQVDSDGRGVINILASEKLFLTPKLYSTFLLWFLSELYESLPEVGDLEKPKMVFFFDEAHLLFQNTNPEVIEKVELIVRLIRSKGIGIFFVTQNPTDIPDSVASQLGHRIQHGLRAFTPKEQKSVKAVAETFRQDQERDLVAEITNLKVGQAVVSFLREDGSPSFADIATIFPPKSLMGVVDPLVRQEIINKSKFYNKYSEPIDRQSAHEELLKMEQTLNEQAQMDLKAQEDLKAQQLEEKERLKQEKELERQARSSTPAGRKTDSTMDRFTKNFMSTVGREVGKVISRGILGMFKK